MLQANTYGLNTNGVTHKSLIINFIITKYLKQKRNAVGRSFHEERISDANVRCLPTFAKKFSTLIFLALLFRTEISPVPSPHRISLTSQTWALGSCFAQNMAERLVAHGYPLTLNPCGIVFNPKSVARTMELALGLRTLDESLLYAHNGLWQHPDFHGSFSRTQCDKALALMRDSIEAANAANTGVQTLLLTLGTAWVFDDVATGETVANCHKLPAERFLRRRMTVSEVVETLENTLRIFKQKSPDLQVVLTVSPVRHLKDGLHENQLSKSILLLAAEELETKLPFVTYFPAYELLLDDLRDYRFFANDFCHPSDKAVDYIWEKFEASFLLPEEEAIRRQAHKVHTALKHRPLHPESEEFQKFEHWLQGEQAKLKAMLKG